MPDTKTHFTFEISLSVLNHLGRNLYRSFMTVLGEAISNAWDADANNVWIFVDKAKNVLVIKDDGDGMTPKDFQGKFLKIGYSKRKDRSSSRRRGRPYIGRKGIGKLALLSCARKISVLTRTSAKEDYVGGAIDNTGLDTAIKNDLTPDEYRLGGVNQGLFRRYKKGHQTGTIIYFEDLHEGITHTLEYVKRLVALHFRFSLIDDSFNIFVNDDRISLSHLKDLIDATQFVWIINELEDPLVSEYIANSPALRGTIPLKAQGRTRGFIGSVVKPSQLKIRTTDEKVGVDLFVNGRLRERDILRHIPSTRVVESYLYGQIHYDDLDDKVDRFSTSREGIIADDPKYAKFLESLRRTVARIMEDWDKLRSALSQDGDPDNPRISRKERKARELFNVVSDEYAPPPRSENKGKVDAWVSQLANDAQFNFASYAECFVSENLVRSYIADQGIALSARATQEVELRRKNEETSKQDGNISIELRRGAGDLSYLSMDHLANLVDKQDPKKASLSRDAKEYKPIRDALAHTALLTDPAKRKLSTVYENIKGRVRTLLFGRGVTGT